MYINVFMAFYNGMLHLKKLLVCYNFITSKQVLQNKITGVVNPKAIKQDGQVQEHV